MTSSGKFLLPIVTCGLPAPGLAWFVPDAANATPDTAKATASTARTPYSDVRVFMSCNSSFSLRCGAKRHGFELRVVRRWGAGRAA